MANTTGNKRIRWNMYLVKDYLKEKTDMELLSNEYHFSYKLNFKCSCGNEFSNTWSDILRRSVTSCLDCKENKRREVMLNKIIVFAKAETDSKLLSKEYVSTTSKLLFECKCGRTFSATWDTFYHYGKRTCDACSGNSNVGLKCSVCDSYHEVHRFYGGELYCSRHYQQLFFHGKILEQTRTDRNSFIVEEKDHSVIVDIYDSKGNIKAYCVVDKYEWFGNLEKYKWTKENKSEKTQGYVVGNVNGRNTPIHRLIMNAEKGEIIDHIDGDGLNNRKTNLRRVDKYQSQMNRGLQSNNKSGHRGVHFHKSIGKWVATIGYHNKNINLGSYDKIEDAISVRKAAEDKYFGEYNRGGL